MMGNAAKGALLSGLVFPGVGQMVLKHYVKGIFFILATTFGLAVIVIKAIQTITVISQELLSNQGADQLDQMVIMYNQILAGISSSAIIWAVVLILLAWILSTLDAFLMGRRLDLAKEALKPDIHSVD